MNQNWNASLYDDKHSFVAEYGEDLISLLQNKAGDRILDLGCGTGDLSLKIAETGAKVVGIDESAEMIEAAKQKYPDIEFIVKDILELDFKEEFDVVFSNAVLHWVKDAETATKKIHQALKTQGKFIAEFGGKGNVKTLESTLINEIQSAKLTPGQDSWFFPSIEEYSKILESNGFKIELIDLYDRPTELGESVDSIANWYRMFSNNLLANIDSSKRDELINLASEKAKVKLKNNDKYYADYVRIRVIATKT